MLTLLHALTCAQFRLARVTREMATPIALLYHHHRHLFHIAIVINLPEKSCSPLEARSSPSRKPSCASGGAEPDSVCCKISSSDMREEKGIGKGSTYVQETQQVKHI